MSRRTRNNYPPLAIDHTYRGSVARQSTLYPLMGWPRARSKISKPGETWSDTIQRDAIGKSLGLHDQWAERLWMLSRADFPYFRTRTNTPEATLDADKVRLQMLNCWPAFYIPKCSVNEDGSARRRRGQSCKRDICPHCYAREIQKLWVRVDNTMFPSAGDEPHKRGRRSRLGLGIAMQELTIPYSDDMCQTARQEIDHCLAETAPELAAAVQNDRRIMIGVAARMVIDPWKRQKKKEQQDDPDGIEYFHGFTTKFRLLWITDPRFIVEGSKSEEGAFSATQIGLKNPTRREVVDAVSKAMRYPTGYLRADPRLATLATETWFYQTPDGRKTRTRSSKTYGRLRGAAAGERKST